MANDRQQHRLTGLPIQALDDLIFQRRSIRRYTDAQLPEAWVQDMLKSAHQAPSPSNSQPVRFVRIGSRLYRDGLKQSIDNGRDRLLAKHQAMKGPARMRNLINAYYRYAEFMITAPELMAVGVTTANMGLSSKLVAAGLMAEDLRQRTDLDMTVGLALNGLLLKAQALGVGSCILTAPLVFIEDAERLLGLEKISINCFVTLGMAAEDPKPTQRLPLGTVVRVI